MEKPNLLIISCSDMKRDPRVFRQIEFLSRSHIVTALGFADPEIEGVEFFLFKEMQKTKLRTLKRAFFLKMRRYAQYYQETFDVSSARKGLDGRSFDLIVANDNDSLPLAFSIKKYAKVLHDAHEYAPRQHESSFLWRFFMQPFREWVCKTYLKRCDALTTVSQGISDEYEKVYRVKAKVVVSAPYYEDLAPSKVYEDRIRLIHHGYANADRKIETLIEMMDEVDGRFTLDLMLIPKEHHLKYFEKVKTLASSRKNVRFVDPVQMQHIASKTNSYDVGIFIAEPLTFNLLHVLPNKFFEFIQARLAVAIGPSPEMARYVSKYDCGVVSKDFTAKSMAEELNKLTKEKVEYYKHQSHLAAKELSAEKSMLAFEEIVSDLLDEKSVVIE